MDEWAAFCATPATAGGEVVAIRAKPPAVAGSLWFVADDIRYCTTSCIVRQTWIARLIDPHRLIKCTALSGHAMHQRRVGLEHFLCAVDRALARRLLDSSDPMFRSCRHFWHRSRTSFGTKAAARLPGLSACAQTRLKIPPEARQVLAAGTVNRDLRFRASRRSCRVRGECLGYS